jgi:hypothetical protein
LTPLKHAKSKFKSFQSQSILTHLLLYFLSSSCFIIANTVHELEAMISEQKNLMEKLTDQCKNLTEKLEDTTNQHK